MGCCAAGAGEGCLPTLHVGEAHLDQVRSTAPLDSAALERALR